MLKNLLILLFLLNTIKSTDSIPSSQLRIVTLSEFGTAEYLTQSNHAHLQGPYPADPHLELRARLEALDTLELNALPPTPASRLTPEEQKLLGHADGVAAHLVTLNIGAEAGEGEGANDGLVGLACAVAPAIVVVEAAIRLLVSYDAIKKTSQNLPSSQHLDKMGLGRTRLITLLQPAENAVLLEQRPSSRTLDLHHFGLTNVGARGDSVEVQILTQYNDAGTLRAVITSCARRRVEGYYAIAAVLGVGRIYGDGLGYCAEELQHVL